MLQVAEDSKVIAVLERLTFAVTEGAPPNEIVLAGDRGLKIDFMPSPDRKR